jgi:hypothetical protein
VRCYDDCLDGAAPPGFGQGGPQQLRAGGRPAGGRGDREVVDIAGEAAGIVDRRRRVEGRDEEARELARFLADEGDDLIAGDEAPQVGAVLVSRRRGRAPEQRLVLGVLLAADSRQGRHRGNIGLRCGAYLITHPPSVARDSALATVCDVGGFCGASDSMSFKITGNLCYLASPNGVSRS